MIWKLISILYLLTNISFVVSSQMGDDLESIKSVRNRNQIFCQIFNYYINFQFFKQRNRTNLTEEEIDENIIEIKALNLSNTQTIGHFQDNSIIIKCP